MPIQSLLLGLPRAYNGPGTRREAAVVKIQQVEELCMDMMHGQGVCSWCATKFLVLGILLLALYIRVQ